MADHRIPSEADAFQRQFDSLALQLRCAMPGVIESFDATTQRCTVTPAVQLKVTLDGAVSYWNLPVVENVPVVVPYAQGAGLMLTLPLKAGDQCLLVFSDRGIDNFLLMGAVTPPPIAASEDTSTPRAHHLSDAICIPGIIADPVAVPEWSQSAIELRDKERQHYISLGPDGIEISDSSATWSMSGGKITVNAPAGIQENASVISSIAAGVNTVQGTNISLGSGSNTITGSLTSTSGVFTDKDGIVSNTHLHSGVLPGGSNTGEPVK